MLTYNVQMRSWGMEVGAQGSLTPVTSVEKRANAIADRILAATEPWDVLCFNEVFDEDGREVLEHRLGTAYPNYVLKADADDRGVGALLVGRRVRLRHRLGPCGASRSASSAEPRCWRHGAEDSGLMLFSKLPFEQASGFRTRWPSSPGMSTGINASPTSPIVPYEDAVGGDKNAAKGVVYAQLELPDESLFNIMISHTQADPLDDIGKNKATRKSQFTAAMALLDSCLGGNTARKEILFCGDFNVQGMPDANGLRPEWTSLLGTPSTMLTKVLQDAWTFEQCPGRLLLGTTPLPDDCDPGITTHAQRLDYVLRPKPYPGRMVAPTHPHRPRRRPDLAHQPDDVHQRPSATVDRPARGGTVQHRQHRGEAGVQHRPPGEPVHLDTARRRDALVPHRRSRGLRVRDGQRLHPGLPRHLHQGRPVRSPTSPSSATPRRPRPRARPCTATPWPKPRSSSGYGSAQRHQRQLLPVLAPLHRHRPQGRHPADAQLAVPRRSAGGCATLLRQSGHGRE